METFVSELGIRDSGSGLWCRGKGCTCKTRLNYELECWDMRTYEAILPCALSPWASRPVVSDGIVLHVSLEVSPVVNGLHDGLQARSYDPRQSTLIGLSKSPHHLRCHL